MAKLRLNKTWQTGVGTLVYDPVRDGLKDIDRHGRINRTKWWCMVETNDDLANYYRWFRESDWWKANAEGDKLIENGRKVPLVGSQWGSHISVGRGERPGSFHVHERVGVLAKEMFGANVDITSDIAKSVWEKHHKELNGIFDEYDSRWKHMDGKRIEFQFQNEPRRAIQRDAEFWFLDIECQELLELREYLGLGDTRMVRINKDKVEVKPYKFHLTIGRREIFNEFTKVTWANFYECTTAIFNKVDRPIRKPDFVVKEGKHFSQYWNMGDGVIRRSNLWGASINEYDWYIADEPFVHSKKWKGTVTAFCKYDDFAPGSNSELRLSIRKKIGY